MIEKVGDHYKLIIIIIKKGLSRRVIQACKRAGAEGGTVLHGRGTQQTSNFLGITIEPEKDIILCLAKNEIVDRILSKTRAAARLDKADTGIAFVINSKSITGIAHLIEKDF
jgi:nitrogen regulatory protein PII